MTIDTKPTAQLLVGIDTSIPHIASVDIQASEAPPESILTALQSLDNVTITLNRSTRAYPFIATILFQKSGAKKGEARSLVRSITRILELHFTVTLG